MPGHGPTGRQEPPGREQFPPIWDKQRTVRVSTTDPERRFILETGEAITLKPSDDESASDPGLAGMRLPAEAFIRLIYGRMDEAHTPPAEATGVELDDLRQIFRGF